MTGMINLLKPPGMSSAQAVSFIKKLTGLKAGHAGTLDPEAAGVLPIMLGKATRLSDYLMDGHKQYLAEVCFGYSTDTQDAQGKVLQRGNQIPSWQDLEDSLPAFLGEILQIPPQYSALKVGGKTAYALAREGKTADLKARKVRIDSIDLLMERGNGRFLIRICSGKGVYIRTLCHDLGEALNCPAHMSWLLREENGSFSLQDAATLEDLTAWGGRSNPGAVAWFVAPEAVLKAFGRYEVDGSLMKLAVNGAKIPLAQLRQIKPSLAVDKKLLYLRDKPLGLYRVQAETLVPLLMLYEK